MVRHRDHGNTDQRNCLLFAGCFTSQQHASVSLERICSDKFMRCHTEIQVADQTVYLTQLQYTDTKPTSPSADPIMPGVWQGRHFSANFEVTGMTCPGKIPRCERELTPRSSTLMTDTLTSRSVRKRTKEGRRARRNREKRGMLSYTPEILAQGFYLCHGAQTTTRKLRR